MRIQGRAKKEGKSWMDKESEGKFIEEMLGTGKKHLDVLEWGAGFSTRYFTAILKSEGIGFKWDAIEYDKDWYKLVERWNLEGNINLVLFEEEYPEDKRWLASRQMTEYVNFPKGKKYDLIFVDGRKRIKCLKVAKDCLKEDGFVLLHDAQRKQYHVSFKYYDYVFLTKYLWKGKPKK